MSEVCRSCGMGVEGSCNCYSPSVSTTVRHIDERIADAEDELIALHCEKEGKEVYMTITVSEEERPLPCDSDTNKDPE